MSLFKNRLREVLDATDGFPIAGSPERRAAFANIFNLDKDEANALLEGKLPEEDLLEKIAAQFDVSPHYLLGEEAELRHSRSNA